MRISSSNGARSALIGLGLALAACQPTAGENAAMNDARTDLGPPADNVMTQGRSGQSLDPEIANTADESRRRADAGADATQQDRSGGFTKGPGAEDTSGRDEQEQPKD